MAERCVTPHCDNGHHHHHGSSLECASQGSSEHVLQPASVPLPPSQTQQNQAANNSDDTILMNRLHKDDLMATLAKHNVLTIDD